MKFVKRKRMRICTEGETNERHELKDENRELQEAMLKGK